MWYSCAPWARSEGSRQECRRRSSQPWGGLLAVVFFAFMVAGGIYRTECVYDNGTHTVSWDAQGDVPYLWSPADSHCEAHTLTRYVLGDIGLLGKVG